MPDSTRSSLLRADPVRHRFTAAVRRAFGQFLAVPLGVVLLFFVLAILIYQLDAAWSDGHVPQGFAWLGRLLGDNQAINGLLTTIASGIITVTSITFSLLLLAVQQGASALTTQVTDQFLMRRVNQLYFGFFVGLSVFVLLTLVTNSQFHRPVFGSAVALLLTTVALCLIVVMIYNTIDQMRPGPIVDAIHGHACRARTSEMRWLEQCRRAARTEWPEIGLIRATETGHLSSIASAKLREALDARYRGKIEVEFIRLLGDRVAVCDPLVRLRRAPEAAIAAEELTVVEQTVRDSLRFDDSRNLADDPRYALHQLATIGWTSISTAKSNPSPGQAVIHRLRDLIARWSRDSEAPKEDAASPFVYRDATCGEAADALELLIVVASESMQVHTLTDAIQSVAALLDNVDTPMADRLADLSRRSLASLGEHVLTANLEEVLNSLENSLRRRHSVREADEVALALSQFRQSTGRLNSRSTRVPNAP